MENTITLRCSDDHFMLEELRFNLQLCFRAFKTLVPRLFNLLPKEIRNVDIFKKKLKTYRKLKRIEMLILAS